MLHIMLLVGMPGTLLLFLSALLLVKTLQLCHGRTCPACTLEGLEQVTQITTSSQTQTTRDLDCATRDRDRETKFL